MDGCYWFSVACATYLFYVGVLHGYVDGSVAEGVSGDEVSVLLKAFLYGFDYSEFFGCVPHEALNVF